MQEEEKDPWEDQRIGSERAAKAKEATSPKRIIKSTHAQWKMKNFVSFRRSPSIFRPLFFILSFLIPRPSSSLPPRPSHSSSFTWPDRRHTRCCTTIQSTYESIGDCHVLLYLRLRRPTETQPRTVGAGWRLSIRLLLTTVHTLLLLLMQELMMLKLKLN